jgi:glutamyl-Q tRNA(Asp) synthetase
LDNTPRQIYLQKQLGYKQPQYLHLPLVLDENNEKLSKQTLAKAIHTDSAENCLKALQAAAQHLGLNDERLYQENASRVSKWLEIAIENYRAILKSE